ncbi:lactose permease [Ilyonectria robusta]|uniref:lactose permease n=1 Tax=Ilyonectria robusta TaxID=1079257 RepID=UPI001E8CFFED|nr:lactose permease [Ilyonectria robusta]KAH8680491.1 lactose permease [Ilyonectria robusta]
MAIDVEPRKVVATEIDHVSSKDFVETNPAGAQLAAVTEADKSSMMSKGMRKLWAVCFVSYFISTMNGFDGSLMGSVNAMEEYQKTFGLDGAGASTGVIFIIYSLGSVAAFPFCGMIADGLGRRKCIAIGCFIVLVGTAIQAPSNTRSQFMGGRFVLGFGAAIAQAAGPVYIVELAHPAFRGVQAGIYNTFWWLGNILAAWTTYGCNKNIQSSWAWRIPTTAQAFLPGIVLLIIMFLPESPRWLIAHDRHEEAIDIFAKYHADGDREAPIVTLQVGEIVEQLQLHDQQHRWWDFRELFSSRATCYRSMMVICMAFFGQWSGNTIVSYFLPAMIENGGITNTSTQLLITAINPIFSMIAAVVGASLLDKLGRRVMLLGGLTGALGCYIAVTAFTARSVDNPNLVYGLIVFIYLFGIFFAGGWTPLQVLYPVECLENHTRARGAGMKFLFLNIASMTNTYGISVGIKKIGWKLYLVFVGWLCVEIAVVYFLFVETAGKTLEELSDIFEAKNPVKKSLEKVKFQISTNSKALSSEHDGTV